MPYAAWEVMHTGIPEVQTVPYEQAAPNLRSVIAVDSGQFVQEEQSEFLVKTLLDFLSTGSRDGGRAHHCLSFKGVIIPVPLSEAK